MPLSESFIESITAAVDAENPAPTEEPNEDVKDEAAEKSDESAETDAADGGEGEDQEEREEGDADSEESGEETDADSSEGDPAGKAGKETDGQPGPVEKPFISFKTQEEMERFVAAFRGAKDGDAVKLPAEVKPEEDPFKDLPKLDPEIHDETVIKLFEGMKGVLKKQHEQLQAVQLQHEETKKASQQAAMKDVEVRFDRCVAGLGDDLKDALGAGSMSALTPGSSQYQKRDAIAAEMAVQAAGYRASGQQVPSFEQLFDKSAKIVLAEEMQSARDSKLKADLRKRAKSHMQRPGGSKGKPQGTAEDEIANMLAQKFDFGR